MREMKTMAARKEKEMTRELLLQKGYDPLIVEAVDGFVLEKTSEQDEPLLLLNPKNYVLLGLPSMTDAVLVSKKALVTVPRKAPTDLDPIAFFFDSLTRQGLLTFIGVFEESELERFLRRLFETLRASEVFEKVAGTIKGPRGTVMTKLQGDSSLPDVLLNIHYWRVIGGVLVGVKYDRLFSFLEKDAKWEMRFRKGPEVVFFSEIFERFKKAVERLVKRSVKKVEDACEGAIYYLTKRDWRFAAYVYFEGKSVEVREVINLETFVKKYAGAKEVTKETLRRALKKAIFEELKGG
ncbi:MAG: hypothetical protein QW650_00135 [Thermofilum sp.]